MGAHSRWCASEWHPTRSDCTCGEALRNLAANLRIAAALCRADTLGYERCANIYGGEPWRPGCGRPCPEGR